MAAYNWPKIMEMKSNKELQEIIEGKTLLNNEDAIAAAINERNEREKNQVILNENEFPEKPEIGRINQTSTKSLLSLVLFIAALYFILGWNIYSIIIVAIVIIIHELGHFVAMKHYDYSDLSIFFIPMIGAFASGNKSEVSQKQNTIISLAGPVPGIIIGTIFYIIGILIENSLLTNIADIFILINMFNLLPILPLDGGKLVKNLFFDDNLKINIIFLWFSIISIAAIAIYIESYILLIIPVALFFQIKQISEIQKIKKILITKNYELNKNYEDLSNEEYWRIRDELATHMSAVVKLVKPNSRFEVPEEKRIVDIIKQFVQKEPIKDMNGWMKVIVIFSWLIVLVLPFIALLILYLAGKMTF